MGAPERNELPAPNSILSANIPQEWRETKIFSDEGKPGEVVTSRPILEERLKFFKQKRNREGRDLKTLRRKREHSEQKRGQMPQTFLLLLGLINHIWCLKQNYNTVCCGSQNMQRSYLRQFYIWLTVELKGCERGKGSDAESECFWNQF